MGKKANLKHSMQNSKNWPGNIFGNDFVHSVILLDVSVEFFLVLSSLLIADSCKLNYCKKRYSIIGRQKHKYLTVSDWDTSRFDCPRPHSQITVISVPSGPQQMFDFRGLTLKTSSLEKYLNPYFQLQLRNDCLSFRRFS